MSKDEQHMNETRLSVAGQDHAPVPREDRGRHHQLQRGIHELYMVNRSLREQSREASPASKPADPREAELTILWRSKLEAGKALGALNQGAAGAKLMLEGIKAVETCGHPRILLEAITEIGAGLGPLDPGRARYLLGLAIKLAESTHRIPERDRAQRLLLELTESLRPADPLPARPVLAGCT